MSHINWTWFAALNPKFILITEYLFKVPVLDAEFNSIPPQIPAHYSVYIYSIIINYQPDFSSLSMNYSPSLSINHVNDNDYDNYFQWDDNDYHYYPLIIIHYSPSLSLITHIPLKMGVWLSFVHLSLHARLELTWMRACRMGIHHCHRAARFGGKPWGHWGYMEIPGTSKKGDIQMIIHISHFIVYVHEISHLINIWYTSTSISNFYHMKYPIWLINI